MKLYPSAEADSVYTIPFELLYKKGYRGVIFDIDNTLVRHGFPADEKIIDFFNQLHLLGMDTCLISNNKEPRVRPFATAVKSKAVWDAHKPSKRNYLYACETMHLDREKVIFVGDQLFTDVFGANMSGIKSILVKPIHPKEEIQIVLKRYLEHIVLFFYHRRKAGEGDLLK